MTGHDIYTLLPIKDLTLLEHNPRTITKEQFEKLCKSIQDDPEFLQCRPILINCVDKVNHVYAGNQRVRAAKKLKMKEIPCRLDYDLDEKIMQKRIIQDNKTYGTFDFDLLANNWDTDLLLDCGFTLDELQLGLDEDGEGTKKEGKKKAEDICPHCGGNI